MQCKSDASRTTQGIVVAVLINHGWGNHPGKSGHGLTNIMTLYISFEHKHYMYISEQLKQYYSHVCSLTIKILVPPALHKTGQQTSVQAVLSEGKLISLLHQIVAAVDVGHPFKYTVYTLYLADSKFGKIECKCW